VLVLALWLVVVVNHSQGTDAGLTGRRCLWVGITNMGPPKVGAPIGIPRACCPGIFFKIYFDMDQEREREGSNKVILT